LARSIRGPAEATYQPVLWQRDPNRVGDVEANRAQLKNDATVDERNPLDPMCLRVIEPNNITSPQVISRDLVHRHVSRVEGVMALAPADTATSLSVIDDEGHRSDVRGYSRLDGSRVSPRSALDGSVALTGPRPRKPDWCRYQVERRVVHPGWLSVSA
jgi:hypothetical protein